MKKNKLRFLFCLSALMMSLSACALKPSEVPSIPSSSEISSEPISEVSSSEEIVKHIVTFDTQGGTYVEPQEVIHGEKVTKPEDPIKNRYEFIHWEYLGEPWEFHSYVVTEDMTLTAVWDIVEYTAIFINHDGTELYRTLVKEGDTATYVGDTPTRSNEGDTQFTFNCWEEISNDGETIIFQAKYDGYTAGLIIEGDSVHQYTGSSEIVYVPSFWNGETITTISDYAFECTSVREVYLPDSIISIGDYAFCNCTSLTSITLPDSVTSIGYFAFAYCHSLTSVTLGNNVTLIDDNAFSGCVSLTSIIIPDSVTSIGDYAFSGCVSLTSIIIPDSVTSIGFIAFAYCRSLTIFCEAESRPSGWDTDWNFANIPVYWAGEWEYDADGNPTPII